MQKYDFTISLMIAKTATKAVKNLKFSRKMQESVEAI